MLPTSSALWVASALCLLSGTFGTPREAPRFDNRIHYILERVERDVQEVTTDSTTSSSDNDGQYHPEPVTVDNGLYHPETEGTTEDDGQYRPDNADGVDTGDKRFDDGSYRPSEYTTVKGAETASETAVETTTEINTAVVVAKSNPVNVSQTTETINATRKLRRNNIHAGEWLEENILPEVSDDGLYKPNLYPIEEHDEKADNGSVAGQRRFDEIVDGNVLVEKSDDGSYRPEAYPVEETDEQVEDYDERANNGSYRASPGGWRRRRRDCENCETEEVQLAPVVFQVGPKENKTSV